MSTVEKIYEIIKRWRAEAAGESNIEIPVQYRLLGSIGHLTISTEFPRTLCGEDNCLFIKYANILASEIEGLKAVHIINGIHEETIWVNVNTSNS